MSFLGTVGRLAGGFITGGPIGLARAGVGELKRLAKPRSSSGGAGTPWRPQIAARAPLDIMRQVGTSLVATGKQGPNLPASFPGAVPEPGFKGGLQRLLPGGQSGFTGAPPGYHINKAYLRHLQAAAAGKQTENPFNEPRAVNVVVRNRKMNPLNPRALRRANARQVAAVRLMRRTLRGTGYSISRGGFGKKRRGGRRW